MKSKENINLKKLIPILFIASIIFSGCGSKKNNTEISQTETDSSSSELTTEINDNLCALENDKVSFETMTAFLNSNKTRSSYAVLTGSMQAYTRGEAQKLIEADIQLLLKKLIPVIL